MGPYPFPNLLGSGPDQVPMKEAGKGKGTYVPIANQSPKPVSGSLIGPLVRQAQVPNLRLGKGYSGPLVPLAYSGNVGSPLSGTSSLRCEDKGTDAVEQE